MQVPVYERATFRPWYVYAWIARRRTHRTVQQTLTVSLAIITKTSTVNR